MSTPERRNLSVYCRGNSLSVSYPASSISLFSVLTCDVRRNYSTEKTATEGEVKASEDMNNPTVDETLERLFGESGDISETVMGGDVLVNAWDPTWYNLADQAIVAVNYFHDVTGLQYGWSIIGVTVLLRVALFPIMVMGQRNTSRMAHVQPELRMMQARYEALGSPTRKDQMQFSSNMKKLFQRYDVNPLKSFVAPLVQLPCFMGMFFGLRKMGDIFPQELSTGGILWFPDLTIADPLYALPILTSITFMALTESTKDQMTQGDPKTGLFMLNMMRGMSIIMLPVLFNFHTAMLCYWTANNIITLAQTKLLMVKSVQAYFGIWDRPKPIPGTEAPSIQDQMSKIFKRLKGEPVDDKARMQQHNREIELMKKAKERRDAMNRGEG